MENFDKAILKLVKEQLRKNKINNSHKIKTLIEKNKKEVIYFVFNLIAKEANELAINELKERLDNFKQEYYDEEEIVSSILDNLYKVQSKGDISDKVLKDDFKILKEKYYAVADELSGLITSSTNNIFLLLPKLLGAYIDNYTCCAEYILKMNFSENSDSGEKYRNKSKNINNFGKKFIYKSYNSKTKRNNLLIDDQIIFSEMIRLEDFIDVVNYSKYEKVNLTLSVLAFERECNLLSVLSNSACVTDIVNNDNIIRRLNSVMDIINFLSKSEDILELFKSQKSADKIKVNDTIKTVAEIEEILLLCDPISSIDNNNSDSEELCLLISDNKKEILQALRKVKNIYTYDPFKEEFNEIIDSIKRSMEKKTFEMLFYYCYQLRFINNRYKNSKDKKDALRELHKKIKYFDNNTFENIDEERIELLRQRELNIEICPVRLEWLQDPIAFKDYINNIKEIDKKQLKNRKRRDRERNIRIKDNLLNND